MAVEVTMLESAFAASDTLRFDDADGVDISATGSLRIYKRGDRSPDVNHGAVAAGLWHHYRITQAEKYPYSDADVLVLGPGVFIDKERSTINYKGENFYSRPDEPEEGPAEDDSEAEEPPPEEGE